MANSKPDPCYKIIYSVIEELNQSLSNEKKIQALGRLICLAREQSSIICNEEFCTIMHQVILNVEDTSLSVKTLVLEALCELLKSKAEYFQDYVEPALLKILEAHKDIENEKIRLADTCSAAANSDPDPAARQLKRLISAGQMPINRAAFATLSNVIKMADACSAAAAVNLPPLPSSRVLIEHISAGQMPMNEAAIKMLTKVVEHHPKPTTLQLLPDVMPALIKAHNHEASPVRMATTSCLVAIHSSVGDDAMRPHLAGLRRYQVKMLYNLMKKVQIQKGAPGHPPSSSSSR